jgi:hypothetical protein
LSRSRRHPKAQPERHIATLAERHYIPPEQIAEPDHLHTARFARFVDP